MPKRLPAISKRKETRSKFLAEFENHDASMFGLKVRLSKDGKKFVRVFYDAKNQ